MQDMMTLVDEEDNIIGPVSKLDGHLRELKISKAQ